jgi:hypothetical protein
MKSTKSSSKQQYCTVPCFQALAVVIGHVRFVIHMPYDKCRRPPRRCPSSDADAVGLQFLHSRSRKHAVRGNGQNYRRLKTFL